MEHNVEKDAGWRKPLWMRWWEFKAWFHRCPECGNRPDKHYDSTGPRWEDDNIARFLGIGQYGCRRCGNGSIAERDALHPKCDRCGKPELHTDHLVGTHGHVVCPFRARVIPPG